MCRPRADAQTLTFRHSHNFHHLNDANLEPQRPSRLKPAQKGFVVWHVLAVAYYLTNSFCQCMPNDEMTFIDLSHTFNDKTIYWGTEPRLDLNVTYNGTIPDKDYWYQKDQISGATHGGTHIDAPCHFSKGKWSISDIPLQHLIVPAVVINIAKHVDGNPNVHLTTDHLLDWEKKFGKIPKGSLLLVYTGWSQFWPDPLKYSGSSDKNVEEFKFPSIEGKTAQWIAENRDIVGIGIDTMSIDVPNAEFPTTHVTMHGKNIYGLENVNNLHLLPPTGSRVYVLPMKLEGASGAPCRIVAELTKEMTNGTASSNAFCSNLSYIMALFLCILFSCKILSSSF